MTMNNTKTNLENTSNELPAATKNEQIPNYIKIQPI